MAVYAARQSSFTTGDTITAAHSNNEFNAILAAFHVSTGHTHDGTTAGDGGPLSTLYSNAISMGTGADTDIAVTFNANSNDGVITWMEDEDYFQFSDDILLSTTEKVQFRDTAIYINSSTDGQLDLVADTEIQIAATTVDINGNVDISGSLTLGGTAITSTAAELNILDGVTSTAAELNILDGVTSTAAELNILDGVTSTAAELNILDGVTSTAAELNILDGVTATATEINIIDGDTSATSTTVADADRVVYNDAGTMKQVAVTDLDTYISATSKTLTNKTLTSPVINTGVSGTAVADEDDMSSNSATKIATQQSIKAYVDSSVSGVSTSWVLEDDDGTEVTVASGKEVKFIGSGLTTNWTDTDNGTDGDPYDLTFTLDAAQTGITSLLATDIKIGEDDETKIDFETANEIHFYANNTEQVYLADNIFGPQSDSDVDLGTTGVRWKDAYIDSVTVTDNVTVGGDLTVNGTTTTVNSTTVTIDDPIFTLGGDSAPGSDDNKDRGIEFRWHNGTAAKVGFFGYDDSASVFTFIPDATNSSEVFSGTAGNVAFGNIAGTLTTAAQTNITSVGALDGGSITSGFGTIDTGSSNITTTGLISGGSLDIDDVLINGTTIGHTDDTDLITLANGAVTVAGTIEGTTITASTALVPDASGGADLGSTSLEWGDVYIADDKKLYLGSDQNFSIEYDEDGNDTTAIVAAGGLSMAPHGSSAGNGTELRFQELAANGANYVGFKAPDSIAANKVFVLPNADGSSGQFLTTDGSTNLSWGDAGGGGSIDLTAEGSITAGKAVIMEPDGEVKQVSGTIGSTISFPTQLFFPLWAGGTNSHQVRNMNSQELYNQILNPHTGINWVVNRSFASDYAVDGSVTAAYDSTATLAHLAGFQIGRDGVYETLTPIVLTGTYWGHRLLYIPGTDIQVIFMHKDSVNWILQAFRFIKGEYTFGAQTTVSGISSGSNGYATASVVWDESADCGVATAQEYSSSTWGKMQSVVWTIDQDTLAITIGSLQDVGTTTGEIGYEGAGARDGGLNCSLVYDEDTEQIVHVRSYRNGQGTGDVDGYVGKVTGGTTRSIVWGSKQTIYDQTGTASYNRPMEAIYDKTSNRLIVSINDSNGDSGNSDAWRYDLLNVTVGSDKSLTVNGNSNVTDSGCQGELSQRMGYMSGISKYIIVYPKQMNSGGGHMGYKTFTTSGTGFSLDSEVMISSGTTFQKSTYPFRLNNVHYDEVNHMIPFFPRYNTQVSAINGQPLWYMQVGDLTTNLRSSQVVGLAGTSASDDGTVTVNVTGGVNESLTGLYKGLGVYVDRLGNIRQRVEDSSIIDEGLVYLGKAVAANKVLMRSPSDELSPLANDTTYGAGLVKVFGNKLPPLDGERLSNIRDNFIPELKNVTPSRFIYTDAATTHQINIPGNYYQGDNPAFYTLQMLISDRGDGSNKYHIRFNNDSGTNYYNSQYYTSGGNISSQNTPGGYANGTDSYFDSVGAQDADVNDKKSFCWIKFTFQNKSQFDYPYNVEDLVGGGSERGDWVMGDSDDRFIDGYLDGGSPGRWAPAWWDSVHIGGDVLSNSSENDYRIRRTKGIGLWQYSTTGATDITRVDVLSGTSDNFEIRYALFAHSIDGSYKAIDYD